MHIMNSKGGTTRPSQEMKLKQRSGDRYKEGNTTLEGEQLVNLMNNIAKQLTPEEILLEEQKVKSSIEEAKKEFEVWKNTDHVSAYRDEEIVLDNHVIIQVYNYSNVPKSSVIIIDDAAKKTFLKILPIAKVLASSSPNLKPGDIVKIPSIYGKTKESGEYNEWLMAKREKPSIVLDWPEPAKYVGKLQDWAQYIHQLDPFVDSGVDDQYVFCVPDRYIQTKLRSEI